MRHDRRFPYGSAVASATFADAVDEALPEARDAVARHWAGARARSAAGGAPIARLLRDAADASAAGKYLRPRLLAAGYLGFGGSDHACLAGLAAAVQVLHSGLCTHDDLIDGDRVRHGAPNAIGRAERDAAAAGLGETSARRHGLTAGVLAGDLAIAGALGLLADLPVGAELRARLVLEAVRAIELTVAGELLDVHGDDPGTETPDPLRTARLKTAVYSFRLPLRLGALAAGTADSGALDALDRVGDGLGVAYQLADDDLGLFGAPEDTGKPAGSDVADGTRTLLVHLALERADRADRARLIAALGDPRASSPGIAEVRAIVTRTGARDAARETARREAERAAETAERELPGPLGEYLSRAARSLIRRDR
ncbi:polyprenyl synthetase family protein [Agromyces mangrovi Wang et al. 2018]|uniref:polyprenyl synthetase family protein n=1 Tax=Agromyces mangrovi TaxID=1858653 RepID=UPI0025736C07|nr:polyprenyl synthetase family protein [Agromyces mangrovi]BDZ65234.1 geranylgeranyl pyrophosphate synthase [Agromyces mangrovi]